VGVDVMPGTVTALVGPVRARLWRALGGDQRGALVEGLDAAAVRVDSEGRVADLNARAAAVLGVDRRGALGRPLSAVAPALSAPDGGVVELSVDGDRRLFELSTPTGDPADGGGWLVARDVTEAERDRRLLANVADPVYMTDADGTVVDVTDALVEELGYDRERLVGAHVGEFTTEAAYEAGVAVVEDLLAAGEDRGSLEGEAVTADGDRRLYRDHVRLVRDDDGALAWTVHSVRDVSRQRARERELEQYETIVETVPVGVFVVDEAGVVVTSNEQGAAMLGYDREDLEGTTIDELKRRGVVDASFPDAATLVDALVDGEGEAAARTYELAVQPADGGDHRVAELEVAPQPGTELSGFIGVLRDVTDRQDRLDELEQYEAIMEVLPDPVYATDAEGRLTFVNRAFEEQLGYDRETADMHFSEFTTPEDTESILELLREMVADDGPERATAGIVVVTTDGRQLRVEDSIALLPGDGGFGGSAGVLRDVTERKRRQEVLTVMNRALRHNLRTNVTSIVGYADLLDREVDGEAETFVERIRGSADWLAKLGDTLRTLQRAIEANITEDVGVDVEAVVEAVAEDARGDHPEADVTVHVATSGSLEAGWPLAYALDNVVENAIVHNDTDEPQVDVWIADAPREGWVDIHVEDDGPGIPDDEREVVVGDAAITQLQHGSGIGLWLTRWLVEVFDGEVVIEDDDPRGTVVTLRLPRSATA
jgi:PAS domain S-box-containing protein